MADEDKTREQLMDELFELRRRVSELETPHNTCVQTEEALDLARHTLQTTLDAVKASVSVLDLDFNLTHVNDVLVKMMGLPVKDSALGRKCFKVLRGRSEICPDCPVAEVYRTKAAVHHTSTVAARPGIKGRILEISVYPVMDKRGSLLGTLHLARDVTARRRAAEALADSEEKYRRLVETSHDIIFTVDLEGNFLFTNQALENILGYSHDEIKQINGFALLHPEDLENVQEHFARLKQGKRVDNLEYRGRAKDGSYLDLLTNGVPIFDSQGNVGAALCISRDITYLKRSLEAVKESEARFRTVFNAVMDSIFIKDVSGRPFDAVIFDLTVPGGMGGKEAVARLLEVDPEVKAIVSSGYSHDPVLADFRSYGFRGVIEKPYEIERLGEVLCQIIGGEDA